MRLTLGTLLSTALVLGGCSGGSDASSGTVIVPTPTPAPTPSPSPTPTPSPTQSAGYTLFSDLAGDQLYSETCTTFSARAAGFTPDSSNSPTFASGLPSLGFQAATQTYVFANPEVAGGLRFSPSDRLPDALANTVNYNNGFAILTINTPTPGGISLGYARRARISNNFATTRCVIGVPTRVTDIPADYAVIYNRYSVEGSAFDKTSGSVLEYSLERTIVGVGVDLTTGMLLITIRVIGSAPGLPDKEFGTFNGQAQLNPAIPGFFGLSEIETGIMSFGGTFFGPQGREFGLSFQIPINERQPFAAPEVFISGTIVGAR